MLDITMLNQNDIESVNSCRGRVVVAYSGGIDSTVVLYLLCKNTEKTIHALHVNHALQDDADDWQRHCEKVCEDLGVELYTVNVDVKRSGNLELAARNARYSAFEHFLLEDDLLVLAHHLDDQIETVLLHLLRGDSPFGLRGMPQERTVGKARLIRPILHIARDRIVEFANEHALDWIEDGSNQNIEFNRNYLRAEIIPRLKSRWTNLSTTIENALIRIEEGMEVIDFVAESDLKEILVDQRKISLEKLKVLTPVRQANVFRIWLKHKGITDVPANRMIKDYLNSLLTARVDAAPLLIWQDIELRRYGDHLYLIHSLEKEDAEERYQFRGDSIVINNGIVNADMTKGQGIVAGRSKYLSIGFRSGGEKIRFQKNRSLKNVFQENDVPSFLRDHIPLIFLDEELVAVCGVASWELPPIVAPHVRADASESGWHFDWQF